MQNLNNYNVEETCSHVTTYSNRFCDHRSIQDTIIYIHFISSIMCNANVREKRRQSISLFMCISAVHPIAAQHRNLILYSYEFLLNLNFEIKKTNRSNIWSNAIFLLYCLLAHVLLIHSPSYLFMSHVSYKCDSTILPCLSSDDITELFIIKRIKCRKYCQEHLLKR